MSPEDYERDQAERDAEQAAILDIIDELDFAKDIEDKLYDQHRDITALHEQIWNGDLDAVADLRTMIQTAAEQAALEVYQMRKSLDAKQREIEDRYV